MRVVVLPALLLTFLTCPWRAVAWGEFGHLTVCDLAYRNLTDTTKAQVNALLKSKSGGITIPARGDNEERRYTSFSVGCLEEDSRPKKHPKDHFINVDRGLAAIVGPACPTSQTTGQPMECIFAGIKRDLNILKDPNQDQQKRVIALMAVGHWVGDLHQPLHISFSDDVGGNNILVSYTGQCGTTPSGNKVRPKNLHSVWDNCLLEAGMFDRVRKRDDFKTTWKRKTITYRAVDTLLANTSLAEEQALVASEPWQWAQESYEITRRPKVRYCFLVTPNCQFTETQFLYSDPSPRGKESIGATYIGDFERIAEDRVRKAGFRLAHLLNGALDPNYTGPIENSGQAL